MKTLILLAALTAAPVYLMPGPADAKAIERACMRSDRGAANKALCGCIQQVADLTLDRRDQRLAASFFNDPHRAQEVRQSADRTHEQFWRKYKQFGTSAAAYCS